MTEPRPVALDCIPVGRDRLRVRVRVQPGALRSGVAGVRDDGAILVRVTAPPVEGRANEALVALLAEWLGLPRRAVSIARGERGRDKWVDISGLSPERLRAYLSEDPKES